MNGVPRDSLVFRAKLAQQCGREDDMLADMRALADAAARDASPLSAEERDLLSLAFKTVVQNLRSSLSIARAIECREKQLAHDNRARLAREYVEKLSREMRETCVSAISCVEARVEASAAETSIDARVFWLKCLGDYWRYLCEVPLGGANADDARNAAANAEDAYRAGIELARDVPMTNPLRLGLYLNQTVLLYEIMGNKRGALEVTDACLRRARAEMARVENSDEREDTEAIVALLHNNAALWRREIEAERELELGVVESSRATTSDDAADDEKPIDLATLHL